MFGSGLAGTAPTARNRIQACDDAETLLRWAENVLAAKTTADVFSDVEPASPRTQAKPGLPAGA